MIKNKRCFNALETDKSTVEARALYRGVREQRLFDARTSTCYDKRLQPNVTGDCQQAGESTLSGLLHNNSKFKAKAAELGPSS